MQPTLNIALRAARGAADKLSYTQTNIASLTAEGASRKDVFDQAIEDAAWRARKAIRKAHQRHHIDTAHLGMDESRDHDGHSLWKINVLVGDTNYRRGYPGYLVNVAYYSKDRIETAVLLDPVTGDEFTAIRGRGIQLNERRMRVEATSLDAALAAIESKDFSEVARWAEKVAEVRITGNGLLSMAYLAAGRVQLAFADNLDDYDFPVASLLIQESGALSGDRNGRPASAKKGELLAASPRLFKQLLVRT